MGSRICPIRLTWLSLRASMPSMPSEAADTAMTTSASSIRCSAISQAMTGIDRMRSRLMALGTVRMTSRASGLYAPDAPDVPVSRLSSVTSVIRCATPAGR